MYYSYFVSYQASAQDTYTKNVIDTIGNTIITYDKEITTIEDIRAFENHIETMLNKKDSTTSRYEFHVTLINFKLVQISPDVVSNERENKLHH